MGRILSWEERVIGDGRWERGMNNFVVGTWERGYELEIFSRGEMGRFTGGNGITVRP